MRKIKYRAKVKNPKRAFVRKEYVPEGQWVYGEPHTIDCPTPHIHTVDVGKQPIDEETICQFTGLYDKNGKEIYEGDILKSRIKKFENIPYVVGYRLGIFENRPNNQILASMPLKYLLNDDEGNTLNSWTIIGNIHDNPELLKGGEK